MKFDTSNQHPRPAGIRRFRRLACLSPGIVLAFALLTAFAPATGDGRAIHEARFDPTYTPTGALLPAIHDSVAALGIGTVSADGAVDCTQVFMNHWFVTDLFNKAAYAAGFSLHPAGGEGQSSVDVREIHFRQGRDALDALDRMDTWGLRNVQFLPPANWFWCLFRGRIVFTSCIDEQPFEGTHGRVVGIILRGLHRQRVKGNMHKPPSKAGANPAEWPHR
jgi:hypothetical protein